MSRSRNRRRRSQSRHVGRHQQENRSHTQRAFAKMSLEALEARTLLAADLAYPADPFDSLVTDFTLVAELNDDEPILRLLDTNSLNEIAAVPLDDPGDVTVSITRSNLPEAFGDTLRIDLNTFNVLDAFVSNNGGLLTIDFDGGLEVPFVSDDTVLVEGNGVYALNYGVQFDSTSAIALDVGSITLDGDFLVESDAAITLATSNITADNIELLATDSKIGEPDDDNLLNVLSTPSAEVTIKDGQLNAGNISIQAIASADVTIDMEELLEGSVTLGAAVAVVDAHVFIGGDAHLNASGNLMVQAISDVQTDVLRVPEDDQDENDDDQTQDAAVASSVINSNSSVTITDEAQLVANGAVTINANNQATVSTIADGTLGSGDAGAILATTTIAGDTTVELSGQTSISATGAVNISANSARSATTHAMATAEGATEDGDNDTNTRTQEALEENNAETSDGDVTLAAAVAVSSITGDTTTQIQGASITSTAGNILIESDATYNAVTLADGTSATGSEGTGVGIGVGIGVVKGDATVQLGDATTLQANAVLASSQVIDSLSQVDA
ncbi:MAG: hypothetical protein KDA87_14400, partial [Planctomycetales bacterium]|nr:hypothetical protein [Planctomycetales bacterium]